MPAITGRQAIIEQFLADGITHMFGNPGTVEQGFLDALRDYPQMQYIATLQETIAVGIADGYARSKKTPTVVQLHSGVGLGNGVGMMYQAKRGHAPLVVLAGESGVVYDAMDAQMAADLVGIAKPVTKWATRVVHPSSLLRVLRRAIKMACTAPMGPVFVALPMDVLDAPFEEEIVPTAMLDTAVAPSEAQVHRVAQALANATRPLMLIGDGIAYSGAQAEITKLAELTGAEVWGVDSSEVNIPGSHPQYLGQLGHMFGEHSRPLTSRSDVVFICGTYVFPEVFPSLSGVFAPGATVIHIDHDDYEIGKNFPVDIGVVADPKATLTPVIAAVQQVMTQQQRQDAQARAAKLGATKQQDVANQKKADEAFNTAVPLHGAPFMRELAAQLPPDAIIFDEALTTSGDLTRYIPPDGRGQYFQTRGGSLGVGVPGAIGLKLANPDKTVVGFSGDGGSMYTIQALWTAAHHRVNAKFVICNNRSYKLLKLNIHEYWRERHIEERDFPESFEITDPDLQFVDIARGMGVAGVRVERPEEIAPAIKQALAHDGPFLIDLVLSSDVPDHFVYHKGGQ